jgi:hypothetical protein
MKPESLDESPNAFSPEQMAKKIGVSRATAYRIIYREGIGYKFGGRLVVYKTDLTSYIDDHRIQAVAGSISCPKKEIIKQIQRKHIG